METHRLVLPGDLNHYGFLFGGRLLAWIDEAAWIAASIDYPHCQFVTVAMDTVEFHHSVREGTILRITCTPTRRQHQRHLQGRRHRREKLRPHPIFSTRITFVSVDDIGRKRPIRA
jgi:acyl-CoA hydrolase